MADPFITFQYCWKGEQSSDAYQTRQEYSRGRGMELVFFSETCLAAQGKDCTTTKIMEYKNSTEEMETVKKKAVTVGGNRAATCLVPALAVAAKQGDVGSGGIVIRRVVVQTLGSDSTVTNLGAGKSGDNPERCAGGDPPPCTTPSPG